MIQLINIQKSYGPEPLFTDVTVSLTRGERISLVGRNGSGKSTLLRLILGEEEPDDGEIVIPKGYRIGHLQQHLALTKSTVLEEACVGLREEDAGQEYRAEEMLFGLGFSKADMLRSPQEFSGGFQIRISLVKVLVSDPDLLLFDEPTNYLDVVSVRWFTRFLKSWKKEAILISHDRDFLDAVSTHTMLIHRGVIKKLEGNTHKLYARVAEDEEIHEKTRINQEKKRAQTEAFIDRFRAKASKASAVQSRVKQLEALPQLEELKAINSLEFRFSYEPFESKFILEGNDLAFSYPGTEKRLFSDLNLRMTGTDRLAVIGRNGLGKSTLLRIIASELTPTTGSVKLHQNARIGYFGQTNIQRLDLSKTVEEEVWSANPKLLRSQVRGLCGTMMFSGSSAEKKIGVLSGGERSRVLLGKILAQPSNIILLDEPTNHLDLESVEAVIEALKEYPGAVIVVTHSERMIRELANRLVIFQHGGAQLFEGNYDDFLERFGWEEETLTLEGTSETKESALSKKDLRKRRAELTAERARTVTPLKKRMDSIEKEIIDLEEREKTHVTALTQASEKGDHKALREHSVAIGDIKQKIESLFSELESVSDQLKIAEKALEG